MRRRTSGLVVVLLCLIGPASTAVAATTLLRLDGIGPVKLGALAKGGHVKNLAVPAVPVCE